MSGRLRPFRLDSAHADGQHGGQGLPGRSPNAPRVRSTEICKNRYISQQEQASEGFNAFAEPVEVEVAPDG